MSWFAVTEGERGATLVSATGPPRRYPAPQVSVVDETGAGNAFVAGMVRGIYDGAKIADCMWMGIAAADVQSESTCPPELSLTSVRDAARRHQ